MSEEKIVIFPGSFDPITLGHLDIIRRASKMFARVIVGVGVSSEKSGLFSGEEKLEIVRSVCGPISGVEVHSYTGLTVDFGKSVKANCIVRGLRGASDLEYENRMTYMNRKLYSDLETIYFPTTTIRELFIFQNKQSLEDWTPTKTMSSAWKWRGALPRKRGDKTIFHCSNQSGQCPRPKFFS